MNSNNTPPLPQPTSYTCRNCGFGWNAPTPYCPRCGAAQSQTPQSKASTGVMIAYGCGFMFLGAIGACFGLVGVGGGLRDIFNPFSFIGFVCIAGALFFLWKLLRGGR